MKLTKAHLQSFGFKRKRDKIYKDFVYIYKGDPKFYFREGDFKTLEELITYLKSICHYRGQQEAFQLVKQNPAILDNLIF